MTNTMKMIYQKSPFQQNITPEIYPTMTMTTMNKQKTHFKVKQQQFEFHHFYFLIKKTEWRNLHEASIHSLQSDDDDDEPKTTNGQLSYESTSIHCSPGERPESPNPANKSKWEIRLPELLNSTVGPDRQVQKKESNIYILFSLLQKREVVRRHTTNIVFQHASEVKQKVINSLVSQIYILHRQTVNRMKQFRIR